jgi:hypothetical protein
MSLGYRDMIGHFHFLYRILTLLFLLLLCLRSYGFKAQDAQSWQSTRFVLNGGIQSPVPRQASILVLPHPHRRLARSMVA